MAEKKGAAALYDNERSQTATDRKDERKGEEKAMEAKAKDKADERAGEAKMESRKEKDAADERKGEEKAADAKPADKMLEAMKALHKQHEAERRDHHGNHREALRQMASRHEKSFRDLVDSFAGSDASGAEVNAPEAAAAAETAKE